MKRAIVLMGCLGAALTGASCGPGVAQNPPQLWLSLNGSEINVRLVPVQPDPF